MENIVLRVKNIDVYYKDLQALWNVSLELKEGKIISIIGSNGSGKSTLLNAISGLLPLTCGTIELFGERIDGLAPHEIVSRGISLVPEGRRVFPRLTIYENLTIGSYPLKSRSSKNQSIDKLYQLFPILKMRQNQKAKFLSGGEQQILAIGRALMSKPKLILCDEISLGLAPLIIKEIYNQLRHINQEGNSIVLVEQDIKRSLKMASQAYILLGGRVVLEGNPNCFTEEQVKKAYFGI